MTYASEYFWKLYEEYVDECFGRHLAMFARLVPSPGAVLDLGCGKVMEGRRLHAGRYLGVDKDPKLCRDSVVCDYRKLDLLERTVDEVGFDPDTILSMFSIELTESCLVNCRYYRDLFRVFPTARRIVSVGFYYDGPRWLDETATENGGLISYQTNFALESGSLHEIRTLERGPSKLFGPDVVEVWRLLERP